MPAMATAMAAALELAMAVAARVRVAWGLAMVVGLPQFGDTHQVCVCVVWRGM